MPTGYTYMITEKDATFPQFVWACARAFGALIMMRDEPSGAPIPLNAEPDTYHTRALAAARRELSILKMKTTRELELACEAHNKAAQDDYQRSKKTRAEEAAKYEAMLKQVKAWEPPTSEHLGLKKFMVEQVEMSMDRYEIRKPEPLGLVEYIAQQFRIAESSIEYHEKHEREDLERERERLKWIKDLHGSVPQPQKML